MYFKLKAAICTYRISVGEGLSVAIKGLQLARIAVTHQPLRAGLHRKGAAPVVVRLDERQCVGLRARHGGTVDAQVLVLILNLFVISRVSSRVSGICRKYKVEMSLYTISKPYLINEVERVKFS